VSLPQLLVVDDEKDNLDALKRLLRKEFEVLTALSAEEGLKILEGGARVDAIVSDQRMPGMTGSEFLGKVQEIDPVATRILLTGFADLEAVVDAVNRGHIWRYVQKPWEPEDLRMTVNQAAERTRMSRSLDQSRRELERALNELRAKDWARERLLQILLHEFRTGPQILESLRQLDGGGPDAEVRLRFLSNLEKRFTLMEQDIESLLSDERRISSLPKESFRLSEVLRPVVTAPHALDAAADDPSVSAPRAVVQEALAHFLDLMSRNSARAPVQVSLEVTKSQPPALYVTYRIEAPGRGPLLPESLSAQKVEAALAWPALLEPFVGVDDFTRHSTGLRMETARVVRQLASLGARSEFQVSGKAEFVELLVAFKT
jgi:FixJ family two-component response regulator